MTGVAKSRPMAAPEQPESTVEAAASDRPPSSSAPGHNSPKRGAVDAEGDQYPTFYELVGEFVHHRLADRVDLAMVVVIACSLAFALLNRSIMLTNQAMVPSVITAALCFLLASRSLRRCQGVGFERTFVAFCAMGGGVMMFELFYHFGTPDSWRFVGQSFTVFGLDLSHRGYAFSIPWVVLLFATVFVGARHMRVNRWLVLVGGAAAGWFLLWIAVGFPLYGEPGRWPEQGPLLQLIPAQFAHPRNAASPGWAAINGWAVLFTTIAKILIGVVPATLFAHHLGRPRAGEAAASDDVLARVWKAVGSRARRILPESRPKWWGRLGRLVVAISARGAAVGLPLQRALGVLTPKLADIADLAMVGVIVVCASLAIVRHSFLLTGGLLAGTMIGYAFCFLLASRALRGRKDLGFERAFIALCTLVSSMWLFEIVFHYWAWNAYPRFWEGFGALNLSAPWLPFALLWALIMVSLVFVGARYVSVNRYSIATLAVAVVITWMWRASGFPTFSSPQLWPLQAPSLPIIPPQYAHATTPEARASIVFWGSLFNTASKIAWCALPGTLFLTPQNLGGPLGARLRPVMPAMKSLLMPWTKWRKPSRPAGGGPSDAPRPSPREEALAPDGRPEAQPAAGLGDLENAGGNP